MHRKHVDTFSTICQHVIHRNPAVINKLSTGISWFSTVIFQKIKKSAGGARSARRPPRPGSGNPGGRTEAKTAAPPGQEESGHAENIPKARDGAAEQAKRMMHDTNRRPARRARSSCRPPNGETEGGAAPAPRTRRATRAPPATKDDPKRHTLPDSG